MSGFKAQFLWLEPQKLHSNPSVTFSSCVILGTVPNLSELQISLLFCGTDTKGYYTRIQWDNIHNQMLSTTPGIGKSSMHFSVKTVSSVFETSHCGP